jgi:hypothetical protein
MFHLHAFVSFSLLWSLASASPTAVLDKRAGQTFSMEQVAVQRTIPWSAPHDIRRTYYKYGVKAPNYVEEAIKNVEAQWANGPGQTTVAVTPFKGDTEYLIKVQVGNHNLTLDPDTGSADLYVLCLL